MVRGLVLLLTLASAARGEEPLRVAAAADLARGIAAVTAAFEAQSGVRVNVTLGGSGVLARQLEARAPYEVFASADERYVDQLAGAGLCDGASRRVYAEGRVVAWVARGPAPATLAALVEPRYRRIALANPQIAPFGRAAEAALRALGVYDQLAPRLVFADNVNAALQLARTGNADVALVARSLVGNDDGAFLPVDAALHAPLRQTAVVCTSDAARQALARRFVALLASDEGHRLLDPGAPPPPVVRTLAPLWLSLEIAGLATLLTMLVGGALALLLATRRFVGRELLDAVVTTPLVLPPTVLGYYLLAVLGREGAIGHAWERVFGAPLVFTRAGAVVAASIGALPLVVKTARAALESVPTSYLRVARTLGAGPWLTLWRVHLPLAAPGLLAALLLAFARALGDFGLTLMVAGDIPGRTQTAALYVYDAIFAGQPGQATTMVLLLSVVGLGVAYAVNRLQPRRRG